MFRQNHVLLLGLLISLCGCNPQNEYNSFISKQGYIPFQQPLAEIGVGALLSGSPQQLRLVSPSKTCFPSSVSGIPTELLQTSKADLPEIAKRISLNAGVDADVIAANGTPLFKLNSKFERVKTLEVHIEGASIEYLDELAFYDWVHSGMSKACGNYLAKGGSFVRQALRVDRMSFQFRDAVGGNIALSVDNIKDIVDIEAHIQWEISNSFTLTITTPKYIGYHLAKASSEDPGVIRWIASSVTKEGEFKFVDAKFLFGIRDRMLRGF